MIPLGRQPSQEPLPARAPKLARAQDPSVVSLLGEGFSTAANLIFTNANAFYEGICLIYPTLTFVMRFHSSCLR